MVADALRLGQTKEQQVEIAERKEQPTADEMRGPLPFPVWQERFHIFDDEDEQGGCGAGASTLGNHLHRSGKFLQAVERIRVGNGDVAQITAKRVND